MRIRAGRTRLAITVALVASFGTSCATSYHDLATASIDGEQYDDAVQYLEQGAVEGDERCDYLLAKLMLSGNLGDELDPEAAAGRMRSAAMAGLPSAQFDLGQLYESGTGVERDMVEAAEWYRKAAVAEVPAAQANLGSLYNEGHGVGKDSALAVSWYEKAANHGVPMAQAALGEALFNGIGVPKDAVTGYMWTMLAAEQHDWTAESNLRTMASQMTVAQRSKARREFAAFHNKEEGRLPDHKLRNQRSKSSDSQKGIHRRSRNNRP